MLFRLLFLPELSRLGAEAGLAAGTVWRGLLALQRPPRSRPLAALAAGALAAGCAAAAARAQAIDPGIFGDVDRATRDVLRFLDQGPGGNVIGEMMLVFNGGLLLLAGALLVWHTVAGTVDTARQGRWGFGGWEILRIVAAVALMAPLPGGYNAAQHAALGLARLGGDFATAVWRPFATQIVGFGGVVLPDPHSGAWRAALGRLLMAETCLRVANEQARLAGDAPYVATRDARAGDAAIRHYDGQGRGMPEDLCGRVTYAGVGGSGPAGIAARGHRTALETLRPAVRELAERLGGHYVPGNPAYGQPVPSPAAALENRGIADAYAATLDIELRRAQDAETRALQTALSDDARTSTWLSAAAFFNTVASRIGQFQHAALTAPSVSAPLASLSRWSPQADAAVKVLTTALAGSDYQPVQFAAAAGAGGSLPGASGSDPALVNGLFDWIDLDAVRIADTGNPIADVAGFGHQLLSRALIAIGTLTAAATGSGLLESIPFVGRGLDVFQSSWQVADAFVTTLIGILLVCGLVLAYLVPAIPFLRFLFGILAWILQVVAATLAVTVFAAGHVTRGDGDRLSTPMTRQGWLFLPALVLRPPLMVFGLILGHFAFVAAVALFNGVWVPLLRDTRASDGLGPVAYLAYLAIYTMIVYALVNASFKLVDMLPAAVMRWLGGGDDGGGDGADRVSGIASAGFGRMAGLRVAARGRGAALPGRGGGG